MDVHYCKVSSRVVGCLSCWLKLSIVNTLLLCLVGCVDPLPSNVPQNGWTIKTGELAITTGTTFHSDMSVDPFGSIYFAGHLEQSSVNHDSHQYQLSKFFTNGNPAWSKTGLTTVTVAETQPGIHDIKVDGNGDPYIIGSKLVSPPSGATPAQIDWLIAKYDTQGNIIWETNLSAKNVDLLNLPIGLELAESTQVFAYGRQVDLNNTGDDQIVLAAYGADGKPLWQKTFLTADALEGYTHATYRNGALYFCYPERSINGSLQWVFMKLDMAGNSVWETRVAEPNLSLHLSVLTTDQMGNLYLSARSKISAPTGHLTKISNEGLFAWKTAFSEPFSVGVKNSGESYVLLGTAPIKLLRIDMNGNINLQKTITFSPQTSILTRDEFDMRVLIDSANRVYLFANVTNVDQTLTWGVVKIMDTAGSELAAIRAEFKVNHHLLAVDGLGSLYLGNSTYLSKYSVTQLVNR